MLRTASVGLGWWSKELASAVQGKSDKIQIVACYSRSADKRVAFAETYSARPLESYEAVLADPEVEAVILTTQHSQHVGHIIQAAAAGKQIFVEKPLALTGASALRAVEACKEAGVTLAVGHNRRFIPAVVALKKLLDEQAFGTPLHFEANFSVPGVQRYSPDFWRANRTESPGGGLTGLGIHMIDLISWLGGRIERATGSVKRQAAPIEIDDTTTALFDLEGGASGYLGCIFMSPYTSFLNIYGTAMNAYCSVDENRLELLRPGETRQPVPLGPNESLKEELEAFADACAGGAPFRVPPLEAAQAVAAMEAIIVSAEEGGRPRQVPKLGSTN